MSRYIINHLAELKKRHYVLKGTGDYYWTAFSGKKVKEYRQKYGVNFCLIIFASPPHDDCYVMPYAQVKNVFLEEFLLEGKWECQITNHEIHVGHTPNIQRMSVRHCYNNFELLLPKTS